MQKQKTPQQEETQMLQKKIKEQLKMIKKIKKKNKS